MGWSAPKTIPNLQLGGHGAETQMALRQSKCPLVGSNFILLKIVGVGDSLQNLERAMSWCSQCGCETEMLQWTHQDPEVLDGWTKIDGERVEGLSCIKLMVNELKDSPISEDTADAERQTKDALCGSRGGDWWVASMASMASMDWCVDRSGDDDGAACFVDFGSTEYHQCE